LRRAVAKDLYKLISTAHRQTAAHPLNLGVIILELIQKQRGSQKTTKDHRLLTEKLNQKGNNTQVVSIDMIMIGILIGIKTVTQIGTFTMMDAVAMIINQS
jgi:hypothetical protein